MKVPAGLGHLLPVHGEKAVHEHRRRFAETGAVQHGGPEQAVEIDDVLADEVVELGGGPGAPEAVEVQPRRAVAQVSEAGHVPDRRVEPDVEVLAGVVGDLEAEVGCIPGDVPFLEPGGEPLVELVRHLALKVTAAGPALEHLLEVREPEEVMIGLPLHRDRPGHRRARVLELTGRIARAAGLAVVAVLIGSPALGALALDEAVGQEHLLHGVVGLRDRPSDDMAGVPVALVDQARAVAVLLRMGRVVVVETDPEGGEIGLVLLGDSRDQRLGGDALLARPQHDRCPVGVVGAHVVALVPAHLLES